MQIVEVKAAQDHLESLTQLRSPMDAIEELVWNALDADAMRIDIEFELAKLDSLQAIIVRDNGTGIPLPVGIDVFSNIGNSPKLNQSLTPGGRAQHGKNGKGRFRAFGLGRSVTWTTRYKAADGWREYEIRGLFATLRKCQIGDELPTLDESSGTKVRITTIDKPLRSLLDYDAGAEELGRRLALHVTRYPGIEIFYDAIRVDPSILEERHIDYPLILIDENGEEHPAELTIIEWKKTTERKLYLCDKDGFTLDERSAGIQAAGFHFTAYLKSDLVKRYVEEAAFATGDMRPEVVRVIEAAKDGLRKHFREREQERVGELVAEWRKEQIYPYESLDQTPLALAERQVFDVCAIKVHEYLPGFVKSDPNNKRLTFRLIKESLETNPQALHTILQQVLELPKDQQVELAAILERTRLSAILNAAKIVLDRLDFLAGLNELLFGSFEKVLLERRQLHRILACELWLFGEQYAKGIDDQGLSDLLRAHIHILGRTDIAPEDCTVTDLDGKQRIVDLMLFQQIPQMKPNHFEHLVIELKRPTCKLGKDEIAQIKSYAFAVADNPRYSKTYTDWTFLLVGNELDDYAKHECDVQEGEFGDIYTSRDGAVKVQVREWSTIIAQAQWRHHFYRDKLEVQVTTADGLHYLRSRHPEFLPELAKAM